jgi:hypothetical protein
MPTFLRLLGVRGYDWVDGKDVWPLVTGEREAVRSEIVTGFGDFGAIRTKKWHYFQKIWGQNPGHGPALYDLEDDYQEQKNVVSKHPQVVADFQAKLSEAFQAPVT